MAETDLSKIVGMILENPELVEKIKGMANKDGENAAALPSEGESSTPAISIPTQAPARSSRRTALLGALKSYLSDERRKSLETMMVIADVLDTMKTK